MLEEAIEVIRLLWQGGYQTHRGKHYRVENARIYSLPEELPPIAVAAGGPEAAKLAGREGRRADLDRTRRGARPGVQRRPAATARATAS